MQASIWNAPANLKENVVSIADRLSESAGAGGGGSGLPNQMGTKYPGMDPPVKTYGATGTPLEVGLQDQANDLYGKAGGVIGNQLAGQAYSPFALQTQQALGRAEANRRAATASAIHSAGFSGTPLGVAAGNATEAELLRNRFDANLGIEVERQNLMNTGVGNALQYGDAVNRWETDKAETQANRAMTAAGSVSSAFSVDFALRDRLRVATTPLAKATVWEGYLDSHPELVDQLRLVFGKEFSVSDVMELYENYEKASSEYWQLVRDYERNGMSLAEAKAKATEKMEAENAAVDVPKTGAENGVVSGDVDVMNVYSPPPHSQVGHVLVKFKNLCQRRGKWIVLFWFMMSRDNVNRRYCVSLGSRLQ